MQSLKQKRQAFVKQIRRKQKDQIYSSNRQKLFGSIYQSHSLQTMVYFIIDSFDNKVNIDNNTNDSLQKLQDEDHQDFLDAITVQINEQQNDQKKLNGQIKDILIKRYASQLSQFYDTYQKIQSQQMFVELLSNSKMFFLIRLYIRLKYISEKELNFLNNIIQSCHIAQQNKIRNLTQIIAINNTQQLLQEDFYKILNILQINYKALKQIVYLKLLQTQIQKRKSYFSNIKLKQFGKANESTLNSNENKTQQKISPQTAQAIGYLTNKWLIQTPIYPLELNQNLHSFLTHPNSNFQLRTKIIQNYMRFANLYFHLIQQSDILQKVFQPNIIKHHPQKIYELFVLIETKCIYYQIDEQIVNQEQQEIRPVEQLIFISIRTIKQVQKQIAKNLSDQQISGVYGKVLNFMIDLLVQNQPKECLLNLQSILSTINSSFGVNPQLIQLFLTKKVNKKQCMLQKMIRNIRNLQFPSLVIFIELLGTISSYSDKSIQIVFNVPQFNCYYEQKSNFSLILKKSLLKHISIQIRRLSYWFLINVAGSQTCYGYAFQFVKDFFINDVLIKDIDSKNITKQQLLIHQSILEIIMGYLSNIRSFGQIDELIKFYRKQINQESQTPDQKQGNKQYYNLLRWIINVYAQMLKTISNQFNLNQGQKFLQVLIYSLYNILIIQKENSQNSQGIIINMLESEQIIKNLQYLYQNFPQQQQKTVVFEMLQKLLDQISKIKGNILI